MTGSNVAAIVGGCVYIAGMSFCFGWCLQLDRQRDLNGSEERISTENAHCASSGGRLVRGQAREFICVDPRGVKWSRAR